MLSKPRHIALLTGGHDTTAMALWLKENTKLPVEYLFLDTGVILPETFKFLKKLENLIGKIKILKTTPYEERLKKLKYFFPTPRYRWCSRQLRIKTLYDYIGEDHVFLYLSVLPNEKIKKDTYRHGHVKNIYTLKQYNIKDTKKICEDHHLYNEEYNLKIKAGCWTCFLNNKTAFLKIFSKHPYFYRKFYYWGLHNKKNYGEHKDKRNRTYLYTMVSDRFLNDLIEYCPQKKRTFIEQTQLAKHKFKEDLKRG